MVYVKVACMHATFFRFYLEKTLKRRTFAPILRSPLTIGRRVSGCSAVRLAHLLWEQGVEGSNPFTPTVENQGASFHYGS